ncbi:MAG: hypothetical protein JRM82_01700 [Nitrososphaerota archaeon]|nr:hypothetical protein [Nitrososphaerota archaeon]
MNLGRKVVWLVAEGVHKFVGDKAEWKSRRIVSDIIRKSNRTEGQVHPSTAYPATGVLHLPSPRLRPHHQR